MLNANELRKISERSKVINFVEKHFSNAEKEAHNGKTSMIVDIVDKNVKRSFIDKVVDYLENLNYAVDVSNKFKAQEPIDVDYPESPKHIGYTIKISW